MSDQSDQSGLTIAYLFIGNIGAHSRLIQQKS